MTAIKNSLVVNSQTLTVKQQPYAVSYTRSSPIRAEFFFIIYVLKINESLFLQKVMLYHHSLVILQ